MVHVFENNGFRIALDVNSSAVHLLDEPVYAFLCACNEQGIKSLREEQAVEAIVQQLARRFPEAELREVIAECRTLEDAGALFSEDDYRDAIAQRMPGKPVVKALCMHVAHDCNLACKYCFAGEGEYHGARGLMSAEVGRAALDFLVANSGSRRNLEVDFFGGEPTLNFGVVRELVAYGRELEKRYDKQFRFTLTTNGVLLDEEITAFCEREMHNVVLSLDGREAVNDRMRPFRGGGGSYAHIFPRIRAFVRARGEKSHYVRGTFTRYNLDFAADVLSLADQGFTQISVEPVVAPPEMDYAIREEDLPEIIAQYDLLAAEMLRREKEGRGFNFFHFMIDLTGGPCVYKRLAGCGSGTEYLAVTPSGDLYPCHQFAGMEDFLMGNVKSGILRPDIAQRFGACNVYSKEACSTCFSRFFCSGGCAANAYHATGEINEVYRIGCEMQRKRVECSLMLQAARDAG